MTTFNLTIYGTHLHEVVNAAIVHHVLKREVSMDGLSMRLADEKLGKQTFESWVAIPPYSTSVEAVLPLLGPFWSSDCRPTRSERVRYEVVVDGHDGYAPTFPLAACVALLRAAGVEVIT